MSRSHESFVSWIIASEPVQRVNGEDVNRKQVSVFSEGLFPFVTHTHQVEKLIKWAICLVELVCLKLMVMICLRVPLWLWNLTIYRVQMRTNILQMWPRVWNFFFLFWWISSFHRKRKGYTRLCGRMGFKVQKKKKCPLSLNLRGNWLFNGARLENE